jgi:integrase
MGTVVSRKRKDGSEAHMAQIAIMRDGIFVFRESRTFDRRPAAAAWIKRREEELATPGALDVISKNGRSPTLADAIDTYIKETMRKIGKTKAQVLNSIKADSLAAMPCDKIASTDIVDFAKRLVTQPKQARVAGEKPQGLQRTPQTVGNYLSHLGAIFAIARPAWGYNLDSQAMEDAVKVAKKLRHTSKSRERNRRPTLAELDALMTHFMEIRRRRPASNPMHVICAFAIFSTRRQEEITRIRWDDLDEAESRVLVRDMKNPGEKIGNDVQCELPPEALRVIRAMPRTKPEIFPFNTDAISAAFTRACKLLGIEDLHFHDLRHDGVSRLFEMGRTIPQAASVSGHRSWQSLKRYTHLSQRGDKYESWRWLEIIAR